MNTGHLNWKNVSFSVKVISILISKVPCQTLTYEDIPLFKREECRKKNKPKKRGLGEYSSADG